MTRMNPEVKAKWVTALRSGKYRQGKGFLKTINGAGVPEYCCLGVLCELAVEDGAIPPSVAADEARTHSFGEDGYAIAVLPTDVVIWAGMNVNNPNLRHDEFGTHTASWINDTLGYSFDRIADLVEENL